MILPPEDYYKTYQMPQTAEEMGRDYLRQEHLKAAIQYCEEEMKI